MDDIPPVDPLPLSVLVLVIVLELERVLEGGDLLLRLPEEFLVGLHVLRNRLIQLGQLLCLRVRQSVRDHLSEVLKSWIESHFRF